MQDIKMKVHELKNGVDKVRNGFEDSTEREINENQLD